MRAGTINSLFLLSRLMGDLDKNAISSPAKHQSNDRMKILHKFYVVIS